MSQLHLEKKKKSSIKLLFEKRKGSKDPSKDERPVSIRPSVAGNYYEYLTAMKQAKDQHSSDLVKEMTPRDRRRITSSKTTPNVSSILKDDTPTDSYLRDIGYISTIASMVPDEIIYKHSDNTISSYQTALMFVDISGFTDLCENYTKCGRGGPSKLSEVLNNYIGAMVQEIITQNGDVLKFSGDAFIAMWKRTSKLTMQDVVHTAIDCALIIQKNYGTHLTSVGITLKVKCAISAGESRFALVGNKKQASYVLVGEPVWDVKAAEYMSSAGDVITTASAWMYVNEAEYCTQPLGDGRHTKVLGVGATWKRVEKVYFDRMVENEFRSDEPLSDDVAADKTKEPDSQSKIFREYSLRPAVVSALKGAWWPCLRRFMLPLVLRAVDNDEPMDFLTEIRHVVILFVNIVTKTESEEELIFVVDEAYKHISSVATKSAGLLNKVSMFDKDLMFLVVFGLRGLKDEDEAQKALLCAFDLKESLQSPNIIIASIGLTSGRTYCGVVGHKLRREYTVIGASVNKAARLMMAYPNKVICDKETFVRSKLDLTQFRLLEPRALKGIPKPGPIYEFNKDGWPDRATIMRHRVLGRSEELNKFKQVLQNAIERHDEQFTRYSYLQYGLILLGPLMVGKKSLAYEFLSIVPNHMRVKDVIKLNEKDKYPFAFIRLLMYTLYGTKPIHLHRNDYENRIRYCLRMIDLTPLQIHAVNVIFGLRFPLPETFQYEGDILQERSVKDMITKMFTNLFPQLRVVVAIEGEYIDDASWTVLMRLLNTKSIFLILTINQNDKVTKVAEACISNNIFVKITLSGIDRWYHGALICQLLDVEAIPLDLEKVVQMASGGLPGWVQNFLITMMQRCELTVVNAPRSEAVEAGCVMPATALLVRESDVRRDVDVLSINVRVASLQTDHTSSEDRSAAYHETIQMAVLADNYSFDNVKEDLTMDVIILKTFDSLTPFEKWLLKCGSVLGDIFSRRMLLHLMQSDCARKVSQAVAKLFEIRVLECEGGDFSRDTSMVMIHPAPTTFTTTNPPYCACLGTRLPPNCRDLPSYAFCGYMKFRHSMFRTTTYELLTETHKNEMHARALLFLERYSRRCVACGAGCFTQLFGQRTDDGLAQNDKMKSRRIRRQIASLSVATRMTVSDSFNIMESDANDEDDDDYSSNTIPVQFPLKRNKAVKRVRSFGSVINENCECLEILLSVYSQVIDHLNVVGSCEKIFEAYMEYVDLSLFILNIPQAIRLLLEVEEYFEKKHTCTQTICQISWMSDYRLARVLTKKAECMTQSGDLTEAKNHLFRAMKLYGRAFPTSRFRVKVRSMQASFEQFLSLYICPRVYVGIDTGFIGQFYDHIGSTLNTLCSFYLQTRDERNAALAAKWALEMSTRNNTRFNLLCMAYANMITVCRLTQEFKRCMKLEKRAMTVCRRKSGHLDITEIHSVCSLYSSIFMFYVEYRKKREGLDFGLAALPMLMHLHDLTTAQNLVLWMLKLLIEEIRLHEMVLLMREFFYLTDHYDLSSETWYYYYAMVMLLDTGYSVEGYGACEKFYITKGDAIMRSKTPEAAWNFFVVMWLVTMRGGAWERSILWEEKIDEIRDVKFDKHVLNTMMLVRMVEGFLIALVNEIDNKNMKKLLVLESTIIRLFNQIERACNDCPRLLPRYLFLFAYYQYLRSKKKHAFHLLNKASDHARLNGDQIIFIWIEHTRNHWKGLLSPKSINYWSDHIEPGHLLDYRTYVPNKTVVIPYTLPLPMECQE